MLSIPEYYSQFVDNRVDLTLTPQIPCPFHNEQHGKSFSYSNQRGIWRCFGACKAGGDVFDLHALNFHLKSRQDAVTHLCDLLGVQSELLPTPEIDVREVERAWLVAKACSIATSPSDWEELDLLMSFYPPEMSDILSFIKAREYVRTD
jgi:DNA primase